ncbi:MAG: hypothetical protein AAGA80_06545 [Cyanobacteria bacterium P01_F01_bin.143]
MSIFHKINYISKPEQKDIPLLTLSLISQPVSYYTSKLHKSDAIYHCYESDVVRYAWSRLIPFREKVLNDTPLFDEFLQLARCNVFCRVGSLNIKDGFSVIRDLRQPLLDVSNQISPNRKWITGVFCLVTYGDILSGNFTYSSMLGVAPDVPKANGDVFIVVSSWKQASGELHNLFTKDIGRMREYGSLR